LRRCDGWRQVQWALLAATGEAERERDA